MAKTLKLDITPRELQLGIFKADIVVALQKRMRVTGSTPVIMAEKLGGMWTADKVVRKLSGFSYMSTTEMSDLCWALDCAPVFTTVTTEEGGV